MKLSSLLLLPLLAPVGATLPPGVTWLTPAAGTQWFGCYRFASVFGVGLCVNQGGFTNQLAKCDHMANVMAQLIDNDGDGQPDDVAVNNEMKTKNYYVFAKETLAEEIGSSTAPYPACETDERKETHAAESCMGMSGGSGIYEAIINSCGSPTNRGAASATDRSTWAAATVPTNGCNPARDATVEEVPTPNSKLEPEPVPENAEREPKPKPKPKPKPDAPLDHRGGRGALPPNLGRKERRLFDEWG